MMHGDGVGVFKYFCAVACFFLMSVTGIVLEGEDQGGAGVPGGGVRLARGRGG